MKWKLNGWEGINFLAPEDWELSSVGGNREKGFFSLDDGYRVRAEVEWNYPSSAFSIDKIIENYIKVIKRKGGNVKCEIREKRESRIIHCKNREEMYSFVFYCRDCGRLLFLRVYLQKGESEEIFSRIISSLSCHSKNGYEFWSVYKFKFSVPEDFRLINSSLKSGYLIFNFRNKEKKEISISQVALGNIILKDKSLAVWTRDNIGKKIVEDSREMREKHSYFYFHYKGSLFSQKKGKSWYCPISNRIFLLTGDIDLSLIKVYCHGEKSDR